MSFQTTDLCDAHSDHLRVVAPMFKQFGGQVKFSGQVVTLKLFEDNSLVRDTLAKPGAGRVLVVDGGGSRRRALFGGNLGTAAVRNGWAGVVIYGCIRDSAELAQLNLGIRALGTMPLRSEKRGEGERDVPVRFAGVTFRPGDHVYVDEDGVVVAHRPLG